MKPEVPIHTKKKYTPILPGPREWPVVKMARNREAFIEEVIGEAIERVKEVRGNNGTLVEELENVMYLEKLRIKQNPWNVDPEDEHSFWSSIKTRLVSYSTDPEEQLDLPEELLREIISRYSHEIAGDFRPSYYRFTRSMVTFGFARLLNASRIKKFGAIWSRELTLQDKIHITGETEHLRKLAKIGTIVMVPTHFSNLDSILIGWVIHAMGLPPFIYGAGLNLFNIGIFSYFMNSLGAYKVDRRKKNMVYLETLKTYANLALRKGCHSLFFPGGTRSRSGKIENRLKMGLLGSAMEAQRILYQQKPEGKSHKLFVVPVVLNYHFVLEAPGLINQYLQQKGQERYYVENDKFSTSAGILKFLVKFFTKGSDISVSIGKPMDLMGNYVNEEGVSISRDGRQVNMRDYFRNAGKITENKQREEQYTRMLAERIVEEYHRINRVFSSHLVAFTAYEILRKRHYKLDLFSLLRLPEEEQVIPYDHFKEVFERLLQRVYVLYEKGKVDLAPHMTREVDEIIKHGLENVGMYHANRTLYRNKNGDILSDDLNKLFYYRNRMDGYDLEKYV
ncbi:1-acyl-sn-glycerol-3-phosphate acyltransferase [Roseivirga sp. BDSF3-8]|uniref:1-acyl-sn-glycerol-3-phosphate acyltransferase n=1 Tax=Roseivirga sp. BDSF3-8 TaxID=3241598 RepID=UPI003531E220